MNHRENLSHSIDLLSTSSRDLLHSMPGIVVHGTEHVARIVLSLADLYHRATRSTLTGPADALLLSQYHALARELATEQDDHAHEYDINADDEYECRLCNSPHPATNIQLFG